MTHLNRKHSFVSICQYICIQIDIRGGTLIETICLNLTLNIGRVCMGLKSISRNGSNWSWIGFNYAAAAALARIVSINPQMSSM